VTFWFGLRGYVDPEFGTDARLGIYHNVQHRLGEVEKCRLIERASVDSIRTSAQSPLPCGCQNNASSRSDRSILLDEPAEKVSAPDRGDLIDRGDRR
jgi:hypothetical protein